MDFEPVENYKSPSEFVSETVRRYKEFVGDRRTVIGFLSGGIDSTTCGKLSILSVGKRNFIARHFDHGGMRKGEWQEVIYYLNNKCYIPTSFHDYSEDFLEAIIEAGEDSERKREALSKKYFDLAIKEAFEFGADFFIHGTIRPDWEETTMGIKRQHNVLLEEQLSRFEKEGIKVIEPLYYLTKDQVKEVARFLSLPPEVIERKPFPGPGLYCRAVGQVSREKMRILREVDALATPKLEKFTKQIATEDYQCLSAIIDNKKEDIDFEAKEYGIKLNESPKITKSRVTGMINGKRTYTNLLLLPSFEPIGKLINASTKIIEDNFEKGIGRCAALIKRKYSSGNYIVVLRSVLTKDFRTAKVAPIKRENLFQVAEAIIWTFPDVSEVYYDITPKPPATIEFE